MGVKVGHRQSVGVANFGSCFQPATNFLRSFIGVLAYAQILVLPALVNVGFIRSQQIEKTLINSMVSTMTFKYKPDPANVS